MYVSARHFRLGRQLISQQHNTWSISSTRICHKYIVGQSDQTRALSGGKSCFHFNVNWYGKVCAWDAFPGTKHYHITFPPYVVCKENGASHTTMPASLNRLTLTPWQRGNVRRAGHLQLQVGQSISWSVSQSINQFPSLKIVHNCMKRGLNGTLPALLCLLCHVKHDDHRQRRSQGTRARMQLNWASTQNKLNSICLAASELNSAQLGNSTQPLNSPKLTSTLFTLRLLLLVCFSAAVLSQKTAFKALGKCRGRWLFVYTVNYRRCALCTVRLQLINLDRGRATCCMCAVNWVLHQQR